MRFQEYDLYREAADDWLASNNGQPHLFDMPAGFFLMPVCSSEQMADYIMLPLLSESGRLWCGVV